MQRVTGLPDDQVVAWESKLEAQVVASLQAVMDKIASRIERVLVAAVTTGPTGDDDPPPMTGELAIPEPTPLPAVLPETPGLPPGQPYISPDDLASIAPLWQQQVAEQVLPLVAQVFVDSAGHVRSQFLDAVAPGVRLGLPGLGSVAAEAYLAQARNTYEQVGDHLWATARAQLSEGFDAGESIPQLAARLRQSAGLSARTAVMVARTSVIEASNAGSMAMARVSGITGMRKSWQATNDRRTRPAHLDAEARYEADPIPLNEPFIVGGYPADYPAADTLPPAQRYRCRCAPLYLMPDRQPDVQPGMAELPGTSTAPPAIEAPEVEPEVLAKATEPGEPGFDLADFPESPPVKVRSSLLRARTDRELIAAWQGEMRAITGRDIIVQLPPDASVLTMREHAEGVLQVLERFPEARLRKISWYDQGSNEYAHVQVGTATLEFNARWASTVQRRAYLASLRSDVAGWDDAAGPGYGWSVRGGRMPQATSWHEMAHILSIETLGGKLKAEAMRITLRRMAADALPDMESIVRRDVSGYATKNMEELIAEAMTDVMANGPRASLLSRELYDMVAREYRAKGFAVRTTDIPDGEAGFEEFTRDAGTFPKAAGPRALASQTVAQLRALAKERGITVPAGTRKADLVRMLDEGAPPVPVSGVSGNPALTATKFVPPDEEVSAAMRHYTLDQGYKGVNSALRRSGGILLDDVDYYVRRDVAALDRAFVEAKGAKRAVSVTRAIPDAREIFPDGEIRIGQTWTDEGFVSTSVESGDSLGAVFAGGERPLRMQIVVPKGTKAISAGPYQRRDLLDPDEVLLDRGLTYRVARDNGLDADGIRRIDVEVIPRGVDVPSAPVPTPVGSAALPARVVAARAELARVRALPVLEDKSRRMSGQNAITTQVEHEGGPPTITKDFSRMGEGPAASKRRADAEELGALVSESVGVRAPAVIRTGPRSVEMEFIEGRVGSDIVPWSKTVRDLDDVVESDDGRLLGLADVLMGNGDRNEGNWIRLADGRLAAIDHEEAFYAPSLGGAADDSFGRAFLDLPRIGTTRWPKSIDIAPADLALIRTRLEALRPEFERLKRGTWHKQMMARLAEVEKRATGTRSRLAGAVESRAVARQAVIDERRAVADSLGEVRELLANGASERALASRARLIAGRTTGAASEDLAGLVRAMESGDADRIRVALGDVAQRRGLTEVGPGGDVVPFDPKIHELVGGARRPPVGTFVQVQRPGYSVRLDDGEVVQLSKAKVDTLTVEEIAERTAVQERKALREAARERNRVIEAQRGTARLLAEVDELAAKGASKTAIRERLDPALREAGQVYAGADAVVVDTLSAALDSGDMAKIRAAVTRAGTKAKIKPIGRAGAKTTFDPDTMEGVGGIDIAPGARVTVVRRGSLLPGVETPEKAQVTPVRAASTAKTVARGDFTGLTRVGPQLGGNPGGTFEAGDGSRWYIKTARDPERLRSEALALDFYRAAGIDVPDVALGQGVTDLGGGTQIASRIIEGAVPDLRQRLADEAYRRSLSEGFAVDAWLGNWDVLGQGLDNVLTTVAGLPIRIEAGGALRFRALGESKDFGPLVTELESMRAAGRSAGRAFSGMTPEEVIASAERVRKITPAKIKALVKRHDLDPELAETLIERRANLLAQAEALAGPKPMTTKEFVRRLKTAKTGDVALDTPSVRLESIIEDSRIQDRLIGIRGVDHDVGLKAIKSYMGIDFDTFNPVLRQKISPHGNEDFARRIGLIDRIIGESSLDHDVVLYRGIGTGRGTFGHDVEAWGDDLSGFTWRDDAYSSASADKAQAFNFFGELPNEERQGVILRMVAPRGSHAVRLSGPEFESEILLSRGSTYRVIADHGWTFQRSQGRLGYAVRVRNLDVEVIVPEKTPPLPWETK